MTNRRIDMSEIALQRTDNRVVLSMTPRHAQLLAASIWLGDADHTEWLDDLAELLTANAGDGDVLTSKPIIEDTAGALPIPADGLDDAKEPLGGAVDQESRGERTSPLQRETPDLLAFQEAVADAAFAEQLAAGIYAVAEEAARQAKTAVAAAAQRTRDSARAAAATRAAATARMAELMAAAVVETARALQADADQEAERVDRAASEAALLVAIAVLPGTENANSVKAAALAATIRAAAVSRAEQTALAAAVVARAAANAAMEAAATAADAAMELELEVVDTATAVQAVATSTARDVATATAHAAEVALAHW